MDLKLHHGCGTLNIQLLLLQNLRSLANLELWGRTEVLKEPCLVLRGGCSRAGAGQECACHGTRRRRGMAQRESERHLRCLGKREPAAGAANNIGPLQNWVNRQ